MAERPISSAPSNDTLRVATYTPLPVDEDTAGFAQPRPAFLSPTSPDSPRDSLARDSYARDSSYAQSTATDSRQLLTNKESFRNEGDPVGELAAVHSKARRRPLVVALIALAILAILIIVIVVPIYFTVIKPKNRTAAGASGGSSTGSSTGPQLPAGTAKPGSKNLISGGDGSTVTASNGSTFTYNNKFGGIWYSDPSNPYSNNAYPNSWTPPLNKSWDFNTDRIYGVNLGGWFVLEPFISPALFQKYPGATDEWSLSTLMAADTANGGLQQIEDHYKTFITEDDIAEIAGAGLNWVRIPVPYWAIDVWGDEPFLAKTSWKYILQAFQWCRKYGIRVKLDLHTVPGSQNGYNHSGKGGQVNFLHGTMGYANAQRVLNYIRIFTEFITQPEYKDLIPIFGIMNEPLLESIGDDILKSFNYEVYTMVRQITGTGAGKGPYISIHDGFQTVTHWAGFMTGADRLIIDGHPYFAFDGSPSTEPLDSGTGDNAGGPWPARACDRWGSVFNTSRSAFGVTIAGEWSNAINDCGLFVRGPANHASFGGDCAPWSDSSTWSAGTKAGVKKLAMATMDSLGDWFFWTWKIGNSQKGIVEAPFWSYKLGLAEGFMPTDPRTALGTCGPSSGPVFNKFDSWMVGGSGAGQLASQLAWPPATFNNAPAPVAQLPQYTPTGTISTLPVPTFTNGAGKAIASGNGWFNANDNTPAPTPISGCSYPNAWDAQNVAIPAGCGGGAAPAGAPATPAVTPPPATDDPTRRR